MRREAAAAVSLIGNTREPSLVPRLGNLGNRRIPRPLGLLRT
jgi:hypothetical protein